MFRKLKEANLTFKSCEPLGLEFNEETGEIISVSANSQSELLGVKTGWVILAVNGDRSPEVYLDIPELKLRSSELTVTFQTDQLDLDPLTPVESATRVPLARRTGVEKIKSYVENLGNGSKSGRINNSSAVSFNRRGGRM